MKRSAILVTLLLATSILFSCAKDHDLRPNYVEGQLLVGFQDTTSFKQAFDLLDSTVLKIDKLNRFFYSIVTSPDSVAIIHSILDTLPYLQPMEDAPNYYVSDYTGKKLKLNFFFDEVSIYDKWDWEAMVKTLRLNEDRYGWKYASVIVPVGKEEHWIEELEQYEIVRYASLNHIMRIQ